jgi:hypothetical protein
MKRRRTLGIAASLLGTGCLRLTGSETDTPATTTGATATPTATRTASATRSPTDASTDSSTDSPTETESETPTETDEPTETPESFEYPPGVTEDTVSPALVFTHIAELRTVGNYTIREQAHPFGLARYEIGSNQRFITEKNGQVQTFVRGDEAFIRAIAAQTLYDYRSGTEFPEELRKSNLNKRGLLEGLIEGGDFAPAGFVRQDGTLYLKTEADGVENEAALLDGSRDRFLARRYHEVSDFSAEGLVTEDGLIKELSAVVTSGENEEIPVEVVVTDIGETTVSKPSWTATAKQKHPRFDVSVVDGGTYIRVEQTGGQEVTLPVGLFVWGHDIETNYDGNNYDGMIEKGKPLYLYRTDEYSRDDNENRLGISNGSRPDESPVADWTGETFVTLHTDPLMLLDNREVVA